MITNDLYIKKSSGEQVKFSVEKLKNSLIKSGADRALAEKITTNVRDELFQGISTKEIYNRAFAMLKATKSHLASKYKLKKAIYELGPTGFPFERYVAAILEASGYQTRVGEIINGRCVKHEVEIGRAHV